MKSYNIIDYDIPASNTFITYGSSTYPAKFETTLASYNNLRADINYAVDNTALDPAKSSWFVHTDDYIRKFVTSLQTQADFDGTNIGNEVYVLKDYIPLMQDGTALNGGTHESVQEGGSKKAGFFTPYHVSTTLTPDLDASVQELVTGGTPEDDVRLYLEYNNLHKEWAWSTDVGISKPAEVESVIATENAVATWADENAVALKNTGVIITDDNEMYGQGVMMMSIGASTTLSEVHRGKVLKITASCDITVPEVTVANKMKGFQCTLINYTSGTVYIKPAAGVTLNSKEAATSPVQTYPAMDGIHSAASIINDSATVWGVYGDLAIAPLS